jgi:hypothetical protein
LSQNAFCTTIVFFGNKDTIVVAADSRVTKKLFEENTFCKIRRINDSLFFAIAGHYGVKEPEEVFAYIQSSAKSARSIPQHMEPTIDFITNQLLQKLNRGFKKLTVDTTCPLLTVLFFGRDCGVLKYCVKYIGPVNPIVDSHTNSITSVAWKVTTDNLVFSDSIEHRIYSVLSTAKVEKIVESYRYLAKVTPIYRIVNCIMGYLLIGDIIYSDLPIDILCITKGGYNWIQRKKECEK